MYLVLQQLQRMQSSKQGMWKGYHLSIEGMQKGYLFCEKMGYKRLRGWTSGRNLPLQCPFFTLRCMPILQILWPFCPSVTRCRNANCGQWCVSLAPNNIKTIERMTWHCFLLHLPQLSALTGCPFWNLTVNGNCFYRELEFPPSPPFFFSSRHSSPQFTHCR